LHHRDIQPVLIRDWSPPMDGITATIWASQATGHPANWTPARPTPTPPASPPDAGATENEEMNGTTHAKTVSKPILRSPDEAFN
jgi:hypothetical protein